MKVIKIEEVKQVGGKYRHHENRDLTQKRHKSKLE